jgi:hypothetical protein
VTRARGLRVLVIIVMSAVALVRTATASADPIVVIVMENQPYATIVGSQQAPFINNVMIARGTLATNYVANINGSLRNYFAMTSGIADNKTAPASENLFHQLQQRGISWAEYEESMPTPCFKGGQSGTVPGGSDPLYTVQHDPAVKYTNIRNNAAVCQAHVLPFTRFDPAGMPRFSFVVPNQCNDMHSQCGGSNIARGDSWLASHVPAMVQHGATVILTWDEGTPRDEHIVTVKYGAGEPALRDTRRYSHFGLLAGLENHFGVSRLNGATNATPLPIP